MPGGALAGAFAATIAGKRLFMQPSHPTGRDAPPNANKIWDSFYGDEDKPFELAFTELSSPDDARADIQRHREVLTKALAEKIAPDWRYDTQDKPESGTIILHRGQKVDVYWAKGNRSYYVSGTAYDEKIDETMKFVAATPDPPASVRH